MNLQGKKNVILFISIMAFIYIAGTLYSLYFSIGQYNNKNSIQLDKSQILSDYGDFNDRNLKSNEPNTIIYHYQFNKELFPRTNYLHWQFVIEKLDSQYFEVYLNDYLIGRHGQRDGRSNLWNGTFFMDFDWEMIKEDNELVIRTYSTYMTGANGKVYFVPKMEGLNSYKTYILIHNFTYGSIQIIFFTSLIIVMLIIGLKLDKYKAVAFIIYMIALLAFAYSMMDYTVSEYITLDYFNYKKTIILAYYIASTFSCLSVALFLNAKFKVNFGHLGLVLIGVSLFFSRDLMEFRNYYSKLNILLVINTLYTLYLIIKNLKRELNRGIILLCGYLFAFFSVTKLVFATSSTIPFDFSIDLPMLMINFVIILLYLILDEYWLMSKQLSFQNVELTKEKNLLYENLGQGFCYIGSDLKVVGQFSVVCEKIFGHNILGDSIAELFFPYNASEAMLMEEALKEMIKGDELAWDAYMNLLPDYIQVGSRKVHVRYLLSKQSYNQPIMIVFSDVTYIKELENQIELSNNKVRLLANAIKNRNEIKYLKEETNDLIVLLNSSDRINQGIKQDLHTLKGNLSQYGFKTAEKVVHELETAIELDSSISLKHIAEAINQVFQSEFDEIRLTIGPNIFELDDKIEISNRELHLIDAIIQSDEHPQLKLKKIQTITSRMKQVNIKQMLFRYEDMIEQLAEKLNRAQTKFVVTGEDIYVNPERIERLIQCLVGVFRNSIYHGIETTEERHLLSKSVDASITCKVWLQDQMLMLIIEDDGRGFEKEFKGEIDTDANLYAGRGLGMMAFKDTVLAYHGNAVMDTEKNKGTRFTISIPYKWVE